jgi:hypothetical protein
VNHNVDQKAAILKTYFNYFCRQANS